MGILVGREASAVGLKCQTGHAIPGDSAVPHLRFTHMRVYAGVDTHRELIESKTFF